MVASNVPGGVRFKTSDGEGAVDTVRKYLIRPIEVIIAAMLAVMLVMILLNVVLRYAFNSGITITEELSRLLFVWLVFLGAVAALFERAHLGVDTLLHMLPRPAKIVCFVLSNALMLYLSWLIFSGSWTQAAINYGSTTPVLGLSQSLYFIPVLVFTAMAMLWFSAMLLKSLRGRLGDDDLVGLRDETAEAIAEARPADRL